MKSLFLFILTFLYFLPNSVIAAGAITKNKQTTSFNQTVSQNSSETEITIGQMGRAKGIIFTQGQKDAGISFTLGNDKIVMQAQLILKLNISKEAINNEMTLEVLINGQPLGNIALASTLTETPSFLFDIPALMVTSKNVLSFKLSGKADLVCYANKAHDHQLIILPASIVKIKTQQLNIPASLSYFPKPFWDPLHITAPPITISFSANVKASQISAASQLASWFGAIADYHQVSFNALVDTLPLTNGIVIGEPGEVIGGLTLPKSTGAMLQVIDNPINPLYKLLLIIGSDNNTLRSAVWWLTQGTQTFKTAQKHVEMQTIPYSRAYDAPHWIATDRPVYLKELITDGQHMSVSGVWHEPLNISFRAAPDLFLWDGYTIPLNISYRFPIGSWINENHSFLNATFNGKFLRGLPVNRVGFLEKIWFQLGGDTRQEQAIIPLEPYMIYGDNQLSLYFNIANNAGVLCKDLLNNNIKSSIQEDSWIDLSKTRHFTLLPNLSFFVGASFPFSKFADFSQSAILLPKNPDSNHLQTLLNLSARAGNATGTAIAHNTVFLGIPDNRDALNSKDILAISTIKEDVFNQQLLADSPYIAENRTLAIRRLTLSQKLLYWIKGFWNLTGLNADRYLSSNQSWRGFLSYRSPWDAKHIVVMATASSSKQLSHLDSDLKSKQINASIRGDTAIITDENGVKSFQIAPQFPSGELPWYMMIVWYANQHSAVLAIITGITSLILGFVLYNTLARRAHKRLNHEL